MGLFDSILGIVCSGVSKMLEFSVVFACAVLEMESHKVIQFPGPFVICDMDLFV